MVIILTRTIIIFAIVLVLVRLMGKAELSQLEPFQLVVTFMIADLASISISDPEVPIIYGISALAGLLFVQVAISYLSMKSELLRRFFCGRPSILVEKGEINVKELKKLRISISDLTEHLRLKDYPSLADVEYAIMEANGDLSVIPKPNKKNLTPDDMQMVMPSQIMPTVIIADGYLYKENLFKYGKDENYLKSVLLQYNITDYKDVIFCYLDENIELQVYKKDALSKS